MNFDYESFQNELKNIDNVFDRMLALLNRTAEFYNTNNRATLSGKCYYGPSSNSPGCAIGRCMDRKNENCKPYLENKLSTAIIYFTYDKLASVFHDWFRKMDLTVLIMIQHLHDLDIHWNESGLSETGMECFENIKSEINKRRMNSQTFAGNYFSSTEQLI